MPGWNRDGDLCRYSLFEVPDPCRARTDEDGDCVQCKVRCVSSDSFKLISNQLILLGRIEADSSVKEGDPRRIVHLLQTVVDQPVLIDLHGGAAVTAA